MTGTAIVDQRRHGIAAIHRDLLNRSNRARQHAHPVDIAAGDVIFADYGPLGSIGVAFT